MHLRPMAGGDVRRVVSGWNQVLVHHQLTEERFRRVMLEDPNYEPEALVVAEGDDGSLLGFSACVLRREVAGRDGGGTEREFRQGYLKGFLVMEGAGEEEASARLLGAAEAYCLRAGKSELTVTVYAGPHVFPAVDLRYPRLRDLLLRNGYRDVATIEDVEVDLRDSGHEARLARARDRVGPDVGVLTWEPGMLPEFRRFVEEGNMRGWFPLGWEARFTRADDLTLILRRKAEIVGWARYEPGRPTAYFGPILVLERERGRGYGALLLLECMLRARAAGSERMHAGWANTGFYTAVGWTIASRYALLKRELRQEGRSQ